MTKNFGLYIHIPFCSKKCDYCNFVSFSLNESVQKQYLQALLSEIDLVKDKYKDKTISTIFIGGGTPSIVYGGFVRELCQKLFSSFKFAKDCEFTIEANPRSLTEEKLKEYLSCGVNRISLGVQSLDEVVLNTIHREQTPQDVYAAFKLLKKYAVKNINADVIVGLPNQTYSSVLKTINYLKPRVQHISVYGLQIEEGTPLYNNIKSGKVAALPDDEVAEIFHKTAKNLARSGFKQYEISNFAKSGFECKHNYSYWNGTNYIGLGVAASSFINDVRFSNTSNFGEYINLLSKRQLPISERENLTINQKREERIMLALRTSKGLNLRAFQKEFGENLLVSKKHAIENLIKLNKIKIEKGFLKVVDFYVSNAVILELI